MAFAATASTRRVPGALLPVVVLAERVISATAPNGDLATASKVVFTAPSACVSLLLTPDGGTVVCGTQGHGPGPDAASGCEKNGAYYVVYSAATGRQLRIAFQSTLACGWDNDVLWADAFARHVIGETMLTRPGRPARFTDQYWVVSAGRFAALPVRLTGQWYSGPAF